MFESAESSIFNVKVRKDRDLKFHRSEVKTVQRESYDLAKRMAVGIMDY